MTPMELGEKFHVRKSKKQKKAFREAIREFALENGYDYKEEKGSFGAVNVILGDPDHAKAIVGGHYDTCAWMPFPNLITPCNPFTFVLCQLIMTASLLLIPAVLTVALGLVVDGRDFSFGNWFWVWYILFWVGLILMMVGPANRHTANDNTSGVVSVLEMARTMPRNQREKVCFVLFDLEEAGLIGSSAYCKAHKKAAKNQIVLNLDCVGDGDYLMMFPTKKLKKDKEKMAALDCITGSFGEKSLSLRKKGFSVYPSDQKNFPYGVGIAAFRKGIAGVLYCSRIHTHKDTVLEQTNVNLLRSALTTYITHL